ncbi:type III polyketide synthase [Paenibacillus sp. J5C_2022]|uniref:type III polyketide synthase n=1 Tax=Paenibacillus sp. J5C2022 TaxID=2977129 RepID=UPI0021D0D13F|nr:type III polyketide synthase [Paenibacillus sp. J5C2022]MCU6711730.1 type III polyketide synthase [Paenibacillus sp. J5C2022]
MIERKLTEERMKGTAIKGIGTAVPFARMDQEDTSARLTEALSRAGEQHSARWAKRIFKQCGVQTRYTCEPNLLEPAETCRYFPSKDSQGTVPTTAERMSLYKEASVPLGVEAARSALQDSGLAPGDITHLITVSCTGQFLPGLDASLVWELGLSTNVTRIPLTFLGCAAGLKAVCVARQLMEGRSDAHALIVCVELCTLHIQPSGGKEELYGASFFGDGASACVVGEVDAESGDCFLLGKEHTVLLPDCRDEMVWEVGDRGFDLYLSPSIPGLIGRIIPGEVERLIGAQAQGAALPELWAIHPGGKGIVDNLQDVFQLSDEQTSASRSILRHYGNMSSATILFVLAEMRRQLRSHDAPQRRSGLALAFGPGITAELLEISYAPASADRNAAASADCREGSYA